MDTTEQTWFITGTSRGFGRTLTRAALQAGGRVAATARRPEQLADLVEEFGERILPLPLDVTDPSAARAALAETHARFGRIDVLVNNAGYANVSPIETTEDADFRTQFETNFWGVYHVTKAAIPLLREQRGGLVVQFSSVGGRVGGSPGLGSYQAAKFAIDGFSRVLRAETAPFGVKVLVVEPSGFRTDWAGSSMTVHDVPEAYAQTVGAMNARMRQSGAGAAGDPVRAAEILVRVAKRRDVPEHLPIGAYAAEASIAQGHRLLDEDTRWREVARSADFAEAYPVPFPPDPAS
ncbi:SDR family NAD(P)-dependent oxidoreductase [Kitasatospora sp. NPDC058032]|uniref:SDR family NAD(P)-dependent oxidoreductase n=1 Tax=Kitasatospora sp. NPDC058032 TaxID=3346307 RepID=UPI0036DB217F